jgi:hypothetical protein
VIFFTIRKERKYHLTVVNQNSLNINNYDTNNDDDGNNNSNNNNKIMIIIHNNITKI